jgi:hypothetical protein
MFDEIGSVEYVPLTTTAAGAVDIKLKAIVQSQGPTKTLVISPEEPFIRRELDYSTEIMYRQMQYLTDIMGKLHRTSDGTEQILDVIKAIDDVVVKVREDQEKALERDVESFRALLGITDIAGVTGPNGSPISLAAPSIYSSPGSVLSANTVGANAVAAARKGNVPPLTAHATFDSLLGLDIDRRHLLVVDVLEAKDLRPIVTGKAEDTYCKVYMKSQDKLSRYHYFIGQYSNVCL